MKPNNTKNKGFGLLEVVIASGILIIVIGASTALSRLAVRTSVVSLDRVQAYNLSQQAMELVRSIRDTNWLQNQDWDRGLELVGNTKTGPFVLNYSNNNDKWALSSGEEKLILDNIEYTRRIFIDAADSEVNSSLQSFGIDNSSSNNLRKIIVEVSWEEYGEVWKNEAATYLSKWTKEF